MLLQKKQESLPLRPCNLPQAKSRLHGPNVERRPGTCCGLAAHQNGPACETVLGPVLLGLLNSLMVKISLSQKELEFKPFFWAANFHRFFTVEKSHPTPTSHGRPGLPASPPNRYSALPLIDTVITSNCHRAAAGTHTPNHYVVLACPEIFFFLSFLPFVHGAVRPDL